jgi:hypothetical protein
VADEHPEMKATAQKLAELVKGNGWGNLKYQYDYLDGENHATSLHISVYNAMKYFYKPRS